MDETIRLISLLLSYNTAQLECCDVRIKSKDLIAFVL